MFYSFYQGNKPFLFICNAFDDSLEYFFSIVVVNLMLVKIGKVNSADSFCFCVDKLDSCFSCFFRQLFGFFEVCCGNYNCVFVKLAGESFSVVDDHVRVKLFDFKDAVFVVSTLDI